MAAGTCLIVDDPLFSEHRASVPHPERPERLTAARAALDRLPEGALVSLPARDASDDELCRVHEARYVEALGMLRHRSGYLDADTYYATSSVDAARRAAGGTVGLVESLLTATKATGLALVRPPGHHATPSRAMGFCLLNNVAVAAAAARSAGADRVAIVDWDVHHGNGTQDAFYADPSVLYVSLHQFPFYPGTGAAGDVGAGDGKGATVNVPLSAGADDAVYQEVFDRIVVPIVDQFAPDVVIVSAGFDAHARDPLAQMCLSGRAYAYMAGRLVEALPEGRKRAAIVLEGGYDLVGLEEGLAATLTALLDPPTKFEGEDLRPALAPRHRADLDRVVAAQRAFWRLY
jgi:acetoin utilization deacetylase AcuC-like enzyme